MAERERPVWVWLPGEVAPVRCGTFAWSPEYGTFAYDDAYKKLPGALPLDPVNLPFSRSRKPASTTRMNGVFGVLRDAAPEGFGLDLLLAKHGRGTLDEVERMDLAPGDGVGAIEVCPSDGIDRKTAFRPPSEDDLKAALAEAEPGFSAGRIVQQLTCADDGTSLGGEKPKLTVACSVNGVTEWWIAKLQGRAAAPFLPVREFVAMTLAAQCGIDAAQVRHTRAGQHEIVLVKRFDRQIVDGGVERCLFASAATVLRLDSDTTREDRDWSYVKLAYEMQRWCADRHQGFAEQQRESWRRMSFNALVGNYDDHPRNHGLLYRNGAWGLSPAYDVVAMLPVRPEQAMAVNRTGTRIATPEAMLVDAASFSYDIPDAWNTLQDMAATVHASWRKLCRDAGMKEELLESLRPAFTLAESIATNAQSVDLSRFERVRRRRAVNRAASE